MHAYRNTLKGAGVEGAVDLGRDVPVVVVEVLQPAALGPEGPHSLVEGQSHGPDGIVGQRGLLEAPRLLRILAPQLGHQLGQEFLGCLPRERESRRSSVTSVPVAYNLFIIYSSTLAVVLRMLVCIFVCLYVGVSDSGKHRQQFGDKYPAL